jgi:cell division protein FtsZ
MHETNQAVTLIMEAADEDAEIIFGTVIDDTMGEEIKVTVIATGLQVTRKETAGFTRPAPRMEAPVYEAPIRLEAAPAKMEPKYEAPKPEYMPENKKTDYAVKSEITFDFEEPKMPAQAASVDSKPKINWAEKLQSAASKYESQKNFEAPVRQTPPSSPSFERPENKPEYTHFDSATPVEAKNENPNQNRESRIKSIAEKLGFFNFDEDEFDTPSFMKKNERNHDSQI